MLLLKKSTDVSNSYYIVKIFLVTSLFLQLASAHHLNERAPSKVLTFLDSISGKATVCGIHNDRKSDTDPLQWTKEIYKKTGELPGLWGGDFSYDNRIYGRDDVIAEAKNQWAQGALVTLMWHACPPTMTEPVQWDDLHIDLTDDQWNELITDSTNLNNIWKSQMDVIAVYLQDLEDSGVEVLWRPLHEMNQANFWWGGRPGPNGTSRLYQITYDYLTNVKGLANLIWVWNIQDLDWTFPEYNPGDEYFDILALDMYSMGYTTQLYNAIVDLSGGKPIAIGECQFLPTPTKLQEQPLWTYFMGWSKLVFDKQNDAELQNVYYSPYTLKLSEMPGWDNAVATNSIGSTNEVNYINIQTVNKKKISMEVTFKGVGELGLYNAKGQLKFSDKIASNGEKKFLFL